MKKEYLLNQFDIKEKPILDSVQNVLFLEEYEKIMEDEKYRNHQDLTAFLRLISGVDQKIAEENIQRIKKIVSREVLDGVSLYFNGAKYTAKHLSDNELRMQYSYGLHECGISVFSVEKRYPRQLALEHNWFSERAFLKIDEEKSIFSLKIIEPHNTRERLFWYCDGRNWKQIDNADGYLEIPTGSFRFTFFPAETIVEAECLVAYTGSQEHSDLISEKDCRELNIHIW